MPELRRFFFWWLSRWFAGVVSGSSSGSATCSGGVDGGSTGSELGAGAGASDMSEARRVASEAADELVASRMYSTTSHVCSVASGANETRLLAVDVCQSWILGVCGACNVPSDLRRASLRFFSSSAFDDRIDLTAGTNADYSISTPHAELDLLPTHLSPVPAACLERGLLCLFEAARADALATRFLLRRGFLWGQRWRLERCLRDEPVGNVLFLVDVRHGCVVAKWGACDANRDERQVR